MYDDHDGKTDAGSAYVFVHTGNTWIQQAKLTAADAAPNAYFGWSVALAGNIALVGAAYDDQPGKPDAGAAYVFVRSGGVWTLQVILSGTGMTGTATDASFGSAVSISGDGNTIAVGGKEIPYSTIAAIDFRAERKVVRKAKATQVAVSRKVTAAPRKAAAATKATVVRAKRKVAKAWTPEQSAELDRRIADFEKNPHDCIPWEQVEADLNKRFGWK